MQNMHKATLLKSDNTVGVVISDRIVTFSKDSNTLSGKFSIDINGEGTFKIVMTDMKPGTWQVKKDGEVFIPYKWVRSDDGILSFEGGKGHYEFSR